MEQLRHMVTFARVAQAGSFSGGARRLGVTSSVASKHVARLEQALGARLLIRGSRRLSLTEVGSAYLEYCARIAEEFEQADRAASRLQAAPSGLLRISAPPAFVTRHVVPHLAEFHRRYPDIRVEFDLSNRLVDLAEDGFDLALRAVRAPPPALASQRLAPLRAVLCASPDYLRRRGTPRALDELAAHDCLTFSFRGLLGSWTFRVDGSDVEVPVRGLFSANTVEPLQGMALAGLGIAQLPTFMIGQDLQDGRLLRVLSALEPRGGAALFAVWLPQPFLPPKLRCFIDFLSEIYGDPPYWDAGPLAEAS